MSPGEWYSPTQPFVTKPPAYERQGVTIDDLIDFTPELRAEAVKLVSLYKMGPIFTPPVVSKWEGPRGTLIMPEVTGGANWQGGSFDPETKRFYIFTNVAIASLGLTPPEEDRSDMLYGARRRAQSESAAARGGAPAPGGGGGGGLNVRGLPLVKPPYATITRDRHEQGRPAVEDPARRHAGQRQEQPGAEGPDHSAHRPAGPHRRADDEDVADRG